MTRRRGESEEKVVFATRQWYYTAVIGRISSHVLLIKSDCAIQ